MGLRTLLLDACRLSIAGTASMLLNFHDITDLKAAEDLLDAKVAERTAELHEANYQLASFSYSASHDLRAPLRAIRGYLDAMLDVLGEAADPQVHHFGRQIADSTERMDRLIEDLLDYSRLAKVEIPKAPTKLADVIAEALQRIETDTAASGAEIVLGLPDEVPRVMAHRGTLVHAIANLVSNAVKFVAPGVTPVVQIRGEPVNGRIRLWVEDNGIGIAPEHHERIFRVFEQLHSRSQYAGTGAGLAIVKRALERMGGTVGLVSEPGRGSRFWIELPRA
jgi:signal transduction histidine kinase